MSGPKHLWSGDWERDSEAAAAARGGRPARFPHREGLEPAEPVARPPSAPPVPPAPAPSAPPAPARARPRRRLKRPRVSRPAAIAAAVVVVIAGAAWAAVALTGSSPRPAAASAPVATPAASSPAASNPAAPRQVSWLGMVIATQPPGVAVVQTVALGTAADRAGVNPGDVIVAIDGRPINRASEILHVLRGLPAGSRVTLQLAYGSDVSQAEITLGQPPSISP